MGDGRCLFRCAAIHGVNALQEVARSRCSSLPLDKHLLHLEQQLSDHIRTEVVSALRAEQAELKVETSNLTFLLDSNVGKCYTSLAHRLEMVSKPSEYAGFLECIALSHVTGRHVFVYEEKEHHYNLLAKFSSSNEHSFEPIRLLYQMETTNRDGHFDIMIVQGRAASDYWTVDNESIIFHSGYHDESSSIVSRVIEFTSGTAPCTQTEQSQISHDSDSKRNTGADGQKETQHKHFKRN